MPHDGREQKKHPDHLNTPRLVANQQGTTVWKWDQQEPFGSTPPNDNPSGLGAFEFPLRFPGQYFDRETGLAQNWLRDYDSSMGRYIESDSIGLKGGLNTYLYVSANPLKSVDPTGMYQCTYSIGSHTMTCIPNNPGNPPFASPDFISGRNGAGCDDCQNNPDRTDISNYGPIPPGIYNVGRPTSNGRRNLTPDPSNGRYAFQLHACPNVATCSRGCIASPSTWSQFSNLLSNEEGDNTLTVIP